LKQFPQVEKQEKNGDNIKNTKGCECLVALVDGYIVSVIIEGKAAAIFS
jgi:hypothetical protein